MRIGDGLGRPTLDGQTSAGRSEEPARGRRHYEQIDLVGRLGAEGARNSSHGVDDLLVKVKRNNAASDPIARKLHLDSCV